MSQSSSDTDPELLLFSRADQRGMLDVVKDEVGVDLSQEMEDFSDSLVTAASNEQAGSGSAVPAGAQGRSAGPARAPTPRLPAPTPRLPPPTGDSVPVITRWPGLHAFGLTVCRWEGAPATRQPAYQYSLTTGKLYTDLLSPVPVRFSYRAVQEPAQLQIRALPVYCDAQHVQTPVRRCAMHRDTAHASNYEVPHVRHVVRAKHPDARHEELGERCSAVVPLEPLEPVTADYTVFYEFACMNTCVGGMNRRRLTVVFTLEEKSSGCVLGRQSLEVKVCKCPHRDCRHDEGRRGEQRRPAKRRREESPAPESAGRRLSVTADDEDMYQALLELRTFLRRYRRRLTSPRPPSGL